MPNFLSTPIIRPDNGKAMLTVTQTTKHLLRLSINVVGNRNIDSRDFGVTGLHLNLSGINSLARNFLNVIKKCCEQKAIPINKMRKSEYPLSSDSVVLNVKHYLRKGLDILFSSEITIIS